MALTKLTKFRFLVTLFVSTAVAFAFGFACGTEAMKDYVMTTLP